MTPGCRYSKVTEPVTMASDDETKVGATTDAAEGDATATTMLSFWEMMLLAWMEPKSTRDT